VRSFCIAQKQQGVADAMIEAQKVLSEKEWLNRMQPEDLRGLTPLFYGQAFPVHRRNFVR
jgi:hypothetical protein